MSDFKAIYFMEWFHRIWGRCVGAVFAIPAVVFWRKGWIASKMKPRVLVLGALIGLEVRGTFEKRTDGSSSGVGRQHSFSATPPDTPGRMSPYAFYVFSTF